MAFVGCGTASGHWENGHAPILPLWYPVLMIRPWNLTSVSRESGKSFPPLSVMDTAVKSLRLIASLRRVR